MFALFVVRATSLSSCQVIANNRKAILRFRSLRDTLTFAVEDIEILYLQSTLGSSLRNFSGFEILPFHSIC